MTVSENDVPEDQISEEEMSKEKLEEKLGEEAEEELTQTISAGFSLQGKKREEEPKESSLWLLTFTDVMALMLTFFVLLYSMSAPDVERWEQMTSAVVTQFKDYYSEEWQAGSLEGISIDRVDFGSALNLDYLSFLLSELVQENERLKETLLIRQKDQLILSLPNDLLFKAGSAEVSREGKRALFAMAGSLGRIRNRIEIVGNTNPGPYRGKNKEFRSNWDLSLARAMSVSGILAELGYRKNVIIRGLSNSRYEELPEDMDSKDRLNMARRLDIIVMKDDGSSRRDFLKLDIGL